MALPRPCRGLAEAVPRSRRGLAEAWARPCVGLTEASQRPRWGPAEATTSSSLGLVGPFRGLADPHRDLSEGSEFARGRQPRAVLVNSHQRASIAVIITAITAIVAPQLNITAITYAHLRGFARTLRGWSEACPRPHRGFSEACLRPSCARAVLALGMAVAAVGEAPLCLPRRMRGC